MFAFVSMYHHSFVSSSALQQKRKLAVAAAEAAYLSSVSSMDSACTVNVSSTLCAEYIPIGELYCCGINTLTRPLAAAAGCRCCWYCCWRLICSMVAERGGGKPATPAARSAPSNPAHKSHHSVHLSHQGRISYMHTSSQCSRIIRSFAPTNPSTRGAHTSAKTNLI